MVRQRLLLLHGHIIGRPSGIQRMTFATHRTTLSPPPPTLAGPSPTKSASSASSHSHLLSWLPQWLTNALRQYWVSECDGRGQECSDGNVRLDQAGQHMLVRFDHVQRDQPTRFLMDSVGNQSLHSMAKNSDKNSLESQDFSEFLILNCNSSGKLRIRHD